MKVECLVQHEVQVFLHSRLMLRHKCSCDDPSGANASRVSQPRAVHLKEWEEPDALTCQASGQPDGAGVGAGLGVWLQQVAEDGVGNEVEHVSWDVAQDHGAGAAVQALDALGLQDAADAVDGAAVQSLVGDADRT